MLGWLALVVVAVLSSALMPGPEARSVDPGDSGRAQQALRAQEVYEPIRESVLVRPGSPATPPLLDDPAARSATQELVTALRESGAVAGLRSPLTADGATLISADGRSALVTFQVAVGDDQRLARYETAVAAIEAVRARHPDLRIAQAGDRSLSVAVDQAIQADFRRSELISLPLTVVILLVVFGSLVAAGHPAAAGRDHRRRHVRVAADDRALDADQQCRLVDGAADRRGGRDRLLAVLPPPGPGGARRRPRPRRGAAGHRAHLRARRGGLRPDRHGCACAGCWSPGSTTSRASPSAPCWSSAWRCSGR